MNVDMLKGKMREAAMTQQDVADLIGVSLSRFNAKLNGYRGAEFSLGEVVAIKKLLSLDPEQVDRIFFTQEAS